MAAFAVMRGSAFSVGMRLPIAVFGLLGTFAPSIVALGLTARSDGPAGIRSLLARILKWRVGIRWYAFAVGYLAIIKVGVALVYRVAVGAWPRFGIVS